METKATYIHINKNDGIKHYILCKKVLPVEYEKYILPYFNMSDKVVLGGSIALNMLELMKLNYSERQPDLDFSLTEAFTPHELAVIVDFFDLRRSDKNSYKPDDKAFVDDNTLKQDLILFSKVEKVEKTDINNPAGVFIDEKQVYKVDFFNNTYLAERDIIPITYVDHEENEWSIKLTHPSIILAAKAKYAFDVRIGKQFKHWEDIEELYQRKNSEKYFRIMRQIEKVMSERKDRQKSVSMSISLDNSF
jgi:hypothetical protein